MGHHKLATNVLIMGKTGVGKSSFINYLYPSAKRETGAGRPITGRGIYRSTLRLENDLSVNLYDTWGLEAGHAAEWKRIIMDEVRKHDICDIKDWFHTIIYCLSAKSARVEYFEKINMLRCGGNRVIVVMTHCDLNNITGAVDKMAEILREECGLRDEDIIRASSVQKKLLGSTLKYPFGKETAIERITANLWESIAEKIPPLLKTHGEAMIEHWREKCLSFIDDDINFFNHLSNDTDRLLMDKINRHARTCRTDFSEHVDTKLDETITYYQRLREKYKGLPVGVFERAVLDLPRFHSFAEDESAEDKAIAVFTMIFVPFFIPFVADCRRDELKKELALFKSRMDAWIDEVRARLGVSIESEAA